MNLQVVPDVMAAARSCAFTLLENATYIERELPNLHLDATFRARIEKVCATLVGTKHDILSEVSELDEVLLLTPPPREKVARYVERIVRWLSEDVAQVHELVVALEAARQRDPALGAACVLITESAANMQLMLNRARTAAERCG